MIAHSYCGRKAAPAIVSQAGTGHPIAVEQHQGDQHEQHLDHPEPNHDLHFRPALQFEMMMDRSHLENALVGHLEVAEAPLGGLGWVRPGMKIAVKVNLISAMRPDAAATVHPALLTALTELLQP